MKKISPVAIAACALLNFTSAVHASPKSMEHKRDQIVTMCQDKPTRIMMIRELLQTKEGKMELAQMPKADTEFRSLYESMTIEPG